MCRLAGTKTRLSGVRCRSSASLAHFVRSLQWTAPLPLLSLPRRMSGKACARAHSKKTSFREKTRRNRHEVSVSSLLTVSVILEIRWNKLHRWQHIRICQKALLDTQNFLHRQYRCALELSTSYQLLKKKNRCLSDKSPYSSQNEDFLHYN